MSEKDTQLQQKDTQLQRVSIKDAGACVGCSPDAEERVLALAPRAYRLTIEWPTCYVSLCPKHETELLVVLLSNYVRRMRRGKNPPELPKDMEPEGQEGQEGQVMKWNDYAGLWEAPD